MPPTDEQLEEYRRERIAEMMDGCPADREKPLTRGEAWLLLRAMIEAAGRFFVFEDVAVEFRQRWAAADPDDIMDGPEMMPLEADE